MAKKTLPVSPNRITVITRGTLLEGTLSVREDVRVSGRIVGTVMAEKRIVVAPEGAIEGGLTAAVADVAGRVQGDLEVAEQLILRSGARVEGRLKAAQFIVEKGAVFNGTCQMGPVATGPQADVPRAAAPPPGEEDEAPALPDWVDALVEQHVAASEQGALPIQIAAPTVHLNHPKADENRPYPATADRRPRP